MPVDHAYKTGYPELLAVDETKDCRSKIGCIRSLFCERSYITNVDGCQLRRREEDPRD